MKNPAKNIHLSIPSLPKPSFARPLSPGCPTDIGVQIARDSTSPWFSTSATTPHAVPVTATALTREASWGSVTSDTRANWMLDSSVPMSTSETRGQWRIQPGSYIAFSLDTESIAQQFPIGSEPYETIVQMSGKKYVGLVVSSYTYPLDGGGDGSSSEGELAEELVVNFVGSSPPGEAGFKDHWIPIFPSTSFSGSGSRRPVPLTTPSSSHIKMSGGSGLLQPSPLQTTTFFPWKDRVQWTTSGTRIIVRKLHESKLRFSLDDEEFARFEERVVEDYASIPSSHPPQPASHPLAQVSSAEMDVDMLEDDEAKMHQERIEKLKVPLFSFPAQVWRDIREANERDDPTRFLDEIDEMEILLSLFSQDDDAMLT